jgi:hypothetical protein
METLVKINTHSFDIRHPCQLLPLGRRQMPKHNQASFLTLPGALLQLSAVGGAAWAKTLA